MSGGEKKPKDILGYAADSQSSDFTPHPQDVPKGGEVESMTINDQKPTTIAGIPSLPQLSMTLHDREGRVVRSELVKTEEDETPSNKAEDSEKGKHKQDDATGKETEASTGEIKSNHSETPGSATALSAKEDIGDNPASTNKPDVPLLTTKSESKETVDKFSDSEDKKRDDVECKEMKAQQDRSTKCNNKQGNLSSFMHDDYVSGLYVFTGTLFFQTLPSQCTHQISKQLDSTRTNSRKPAISRCFQNRYELRT